MDQDHANKWNIFQEKINGIEDRLTKGEFGNGNGKGKENGENGEGKISQFVDKTPKEVLDHIEDRLQLNLSPRGVKQFDVNCSPPNTDRLVQTFRVK